MIKQDRGVAWSVTASGTSTATATKTGVANVTYFVTDFAASTATNGSTVAVYDGNTIIWQATMVSLSTSSTPYSENFTTPLAITPGNSVKITANGTTATYVNMAGFAINNT